MEEGQSKWREFRSYHRKTDDDEEEEEDEHEHENQLGGRAGPARAGHQPINLKRTHCSFRVRSRFSACLATRLILRRHSCSSSSSSSCSSSSSSSSSLEDRDGLLGWRKDKASGGNFARTTRKTDEDDNDDDDEEEENEHEH